MMTTLENFCVKVFEENLVLDEDFARFLLSEEIKMSEDKERKLTEFLSDVIKRFPELRVEVNAIKDLNGKSFLRKLYEIGLEKVIKPNETEFRELVQDKYLAVQLFTQLVLRNELFESLIKDKLILMHSLGMLGLVDDLIEYIENQKELFRTLVISYIIMRAFPHFAYRVMIAATTVYPAEILSAID